MRLILPALLFSSVAYAGPTVVIDPGHGGPKSGARTTSGSLEKTIVLKIARAAQQRLQKKGISVLLTRAGDRNLTLDARVGLANRSGAEAFVSIHANHAPVPERRGSETYILSAQASDTFTLALLKHEGEDEEEPLPKARAKPKDGQSPELDFILGDLERTAAHQDSALLARRIQDRLSKIRGLRPSRGLRQGPFRVLKGAKMAAVLVEVGYLSNPRQGAYLSSRAGQRAAGNAIARGVLRYLNSLKKKR